MLCFIAGEKEVSMTRFREEVYATKRFRTQVRLQRGNHKSDTESETTRILAYEYERGSLRPEYLAKAKKKQAKRAVQERLI